MLLKTTDLKSLMEKHLLILNGSISGDLFDMLLPMLSIYQEYVRNHHYSLQVLTECKSNTNFATVLKRLEGKCVFIIDGKQSWVD